MVDVLVVVEYLLRHLWLHRLWGLRLRHHHVTDTRLMVEPYGVDIRTGRGLEVCSDANALEFFRLPVLGLSMATPMAMVMGPAFVARFALLRFLPYETVAGKPKHFHVTLVVVMVALVPVPFLNAGLILKLGQAGMEPSVVLSALLLLKSGLNVPLLRGGEQTFLLGN